MNSRSNRKSSQPDAKPLIFVVDDEPLLLELAASLLEPLAFEVQTFRSAETALAAFSKADPRPVLLITDYAMHHMNGMEFIAECRRIRSAQKIILVSGTVDESIYQNSAAKPDYFLAKPYPAKKFVSLVESALAG
jgi:two-component system, LuxR family, response regulator FixJ